MGVELDADKREMLAGTINTELSLDRLYFLDDERQAKSIAAMSHELAEIGTPGAAVAFY